MILVALAELCISHSEVDRPYESEECKSNKRLIDDGGHLIYRRGGMRPAKSHESGSKFDPGFIKSTIEMSTLRTTAHVRQYILGTHRRKGHKLNLGWNSGHTCYYVDSELNGEIGSPSHCHGIE